jgi:Mn2+/Fe2+ NRAMP family transporter
MKCIVDLSGVETVNLARLRKTATVGDACGGNFNKWGRKIGELRTPRWLTGLAGVIAVVMVVLAVIMVVLTAGADGPSFA